MLPRIAFTDGNVRPLLPAKPARRPPGLPELIDRRLALSARWDRLRDARDAADDDTPEGDAKAEHLGALMARCMVQVGVLNDRVAGLMLRLGVNQVWHDGWLVEAYCPPGLSATRRTRFARCPRARDVSPARVINPLSVVVSDQAAS